jgi:hypothetical protein
MSKENATLAQALSNSVSVSYLSSLVARLVLVHFGSTNRGLKQHPVALLPFAINVGSRAIPKHAVKRQAACYMMRPHEFVYRLLLRSDLAVVRLHMALAIF